MFVNNTDDPIIWSLFPGRALRQISEVTFVLAVLLPLLPFPFVRFDVRFLKVLEWMLQRCIEHNRGAFLALCILLGSSGAFLKVLIGKK